MNIMRLWLADGMIIDNRTIPKSEDHVIENITEYIDLFLSENLRVTDISEQCGLSYSCFAKKFREQYGMLNAKAVISLPLKFPTGLLTLLTIVPESVWASVLLLSYFLTFRKFCCTLVVNLSY